jgi:hypothetical protein
MQLIKTCNVILLAAVGNIDTSGISMLEETKKIAERREQQVILSLISFFNHESKFSYRMLIVALFFNLEIFPFL